MSYIKLYENFLQERNKLDNNMLNEILDLIPDILDTGCIDYEFKHSPISLNLPDRYELKLSLNYKKSPSFVEGRTSYNYCENFFKKYLSVFKSDFKRLDSMLNDYNINYIWTHHKMIMNHSLIEWVFKDSSFLSETYKIDGKLKHEFFYSRFDNLKIQLSLK